MPKSAAILHNTLNTAGGGERVCLTMIEALLEKGYDVTLLTAEKTDWNKVENALGTFPFSEKFHEKYALPFGIRPRVFGIYQRLLAGIYASLLYRKSFDFIINTFGDITPLMCKYTYVYFPIYLMMNDGSSKYSTSNFWKLYFAPYALYQKLHYPNYLRNTIPLCTSKYTQDVLKSLYPNYGHVLYPPVEVDTFRNENLERENMVVTCSRFTPEKNLHIIPKIAAHTPNIEYHIVGGTNRLSGPVISKILAEKERLGCSNVYLHTDVSKQELKRLYGRAKVYLHTMIGEHFGISIVEGMAAGLIPVVHRSGGAYQDIVERDRYGFSYENPDEAADIIGSLIDNSEKQKEYRQIAIERSQRFGKEKFKEEFVRLVCDTE